MLPRSLVELITRIRQSASLLRADHVLLRRTQASNSDRVLRALSDVRCRVAVRTSLRLVCAQIDVSNKICK